MFGVAFTILGIVTFFDKGFLIMGNLLFLSGVALLIGFVNTFNFFFQRRKWKGTVCFFVGVLLVFMGRSFFGTVLEGIGAFVLFGHFIPTVLGFLENIPVIGSVIRRITGSHGRDRLPH